MPEGPELHMAARFINQVAKKFSFGGKIVKSEVSTKNPDVEFEAKAYQISAETRGKELKVFLQDKKNSGSKLHILFRFGMSGCFKLTTVDDLPKHAHLRFFTLEKPQQVLSFVDYRRFGRWEIEGDWGKDRGPDPIVDYENFRENVLSHLAVAAFNRPICETLLNQKFFNGIGNYLRAEILFRAGIQPFTQAREVLEPLVDKKVKTEGPDILELCHIIPKEVLKLDKGKNYDPDSEGSEGSFSNWLQCYYVPGMKNLQDGNGRTIWFSGEPGPMAPKNAKVVKRKGGTGSKVPKSGTDAGKVKTEPEEEKPLTVKKEPGEKTEHVGKKASKTIKEPGEKSKKGTLESVAKESNLNKEVKVIKREIKTEVKAELPVPTKRSRRNKSAKSENFYSED